ncbi:hypothetical protein BDB00DRAFT_765032 [Zychaea mexicana]|uniref:uncharacterized protein n=1 Tax=Zychaea mexicana TaxID=64656 RepID=UPI0022FE86BE|nr:uncharacterized protein BDB00DRAFT_765032 [Zychaea mexicana]KAI9492736.1 hypothetical protein BDB00DRAFT_765032 [Zychaea mexicana]
MSVSSSVYHSASIAQPTTTQQSSQLNQQLQQQPSLFEYLSELVSKRVATIKYLRRAHEGNTHWFNTILLTKNDLTSIYPNKNIFRKARGKDDAGYSEGGEYTHLMLPHVPFDLDYFETFYTLTDILVEAYQKLLIGSEGCNQAYFELVLKCDSKFKKIFTLVTKELDAVARNAIKEELKLIDPLSNSNRIPPIDFEGADVV